MRFAPAFLTLSLGSIALVVACTGGPGAIEQGGDNGDQYGSGTKDPSGGNITADLSSSGISSSTSSSTSGVVGSSTSSGVVIGSSTTSSGTVYAPQPDLKASDYNQSCSQDYDCQQVYEGASCSQCVYSCYNAAIAQSDFSKYSSDRSNRYVKCDPSLRSSSCSCPNTGTTQRAYCDPGTKKCKYGVKPDAG